MNLLMILCSLGFDVAQRSKKTKTQVINISPPFHLKERWFKDHLAFSLSKYAMSMCTLGMAAEFQQEGVAVNSLWPETTIATQTIQDHFLPEVYFGSRWPLVMADAAYETSLSQELFLSKEV